MKVTYSRTRDDHRYVLEVDYSSLPEHMMDGARARVERGLECGSFLSAVFANKLVESFARADHTNQARMFDWAQWLYGECPLRARNDGAEEWMRTGGLFGQGWQIESEQ